MNARLLWLSFLLALPAAAQTCQSEVKDPRTVRLESKAELVGDVVVDVHGRPSHTPGNADSSREFHAFVQCERDVAHHRPGQSR